MDASRRKWFAGVGAVLAGGAAWSWARQVRGVAPRALQACTREAAAVPGVAAMPEETAGPFPLHSLLDDPAIIRREIAHGRDGIALDIELRLLDVADGKPVTDAGVYVWHCDRDGAYSGYGRYIGDRFCRGLQFADCDGRVRFRTIFPGWYAGRATHVHFQVYLTDGGRLASTSQFTFPEALVRAVQATHGYPVADPVAPGQDFVFADGIGHQVARIDGTPADGLRATLDVGLRRA